MSIFEPDNQIEILRLEKLDDAPAGRRGEDREWWEADVLTGDEGPLTIVLWVTGTDFHRIRGNPDHWVRDELEKLGHTYSAAELYALSEIQLHPVD